MNLYDHIIFNNGGSSQTVNIAIDENTSGFYISGRYGTKYQVKSYSYK